MGESTKQSLIEALRSTGDRAVAALRAVPADAWDGGRYENGWTARQILAHVAAIEWTYARLIDVARGGDAPPATVPAASEVKRTTPEESPQHASRPPRGGIDDYNARQVEKRAALPVAELISELETNRAATIAAVERADDALFDTPIRSAGGITGPLADVIRAVAIEHVMGHVSDITGEKWEGKRW
ncbi:MAG TPA: maleylpyruvate isomerase N-terminal domain-containing protein [Dehalococcoidia bacterium]